MRASTLVRSLVAGLVMAGCSGDATSPLEAGGDTPSGLALNRTSISASIGDTVRLHLVGLDARQASAGKVQWQVIDPEVALVEDGLVIPVGEGRTQVVAFVGSTKVSASIQASAMGVSPTGLLLPNAPFQLTPGDSAQINAELGYTNGVEIKLRSSIRWSSLDPTVATVNGGMVTARKAGTTSVVAQLHGMRDTMDVIVGAMDTPEEPAPAEPETEEQPVSGPSPAPDPTPAPAPLPIPAPDAGSFVRPELPRAYLSTAMPAVTGRTISVPAGGSLQGAIDSARPGDEIVLQAGATYTGTSTLRRKEGTGWITIRSSGALPPEGTRVTPAHAAQMPRLVAAYSTEPVIRTEAGASHYRLVGLEVTAKDGATKAHALVTLGESGKAQDTADKQPHHLVLDRMYVHGTPQLDFQRCIALNSASTAIVDSWISECHGKGYDSQAIWGSNGAGPYKIVNNHLAGAGENIMFGGADPKIPGQLPRDIEIRRNHFHKPAEWQGRWSVKNLLELKFGQRVLIEGNIFENNWGDAQMGFAIVLKSTNQSGTAPWSETSDVTFRYNVIRNSAHGVSISGAPESKPAIPASRMLFEHNVFERIGGGDFKGGRAWQVSDIAHLTLRNNTSIGRTHGLIFAGKPLTDFVMTNNILGQGTYTLNSDKGRGQAALERFAPGAVFTGNVLIGANPNQGPKEHNYFAPNLDAVGFVHPENDLRLRSSSTYAALGIGADVPTVQTATLGVVL